MSLGWGDYFQFAQRLLAEPQIFGGRLEEAALRSAISRAYYAAYHRAIDVAVERDNFEPELGKDDHKRIIEHYLFSADKSYQAIGNHLDRLRKNRNQADYDEPIRKVGSMATFSLWMAKSIIDELEGFPSA